MNVIYPLAVTVTNLAEGYLIKPPVKLFDNLIIIPH